MGQSHHEQWQHLYQQKSHSFLEEKCYRASGVTDMAELQASFSDLERLYRLQHFSDIVRAFQPSLVNVNPLHWLYHQQHRVSMLLVWYGALFRRWLRYGRSLPRCERFIHLLTIQIVPQVYLWMS